MPNGERWVPGLKVREVELPPLLLWEKGDRFWPSAVAQYSPTEWSEEQAFRTFRGSAPPLSIFVAYRMNFNESRKFRDDLEQALKSHPHLLQLQVKDGRVPLGAKWADAIRTRIKKSKAVVADVTGMRGDVLFEVGFAYGLRKVVIPVVANSEAWHTLPSWLAATQIGDYSSESGILSIVSSIAAHLSDPEFSKVDRPPEPVPGLAVFFRPLDWNSQARAEFETAALQEGLRPEVVEQGSQYEHIIRRAAGASLLVASLDGTDVDSLTHYICGAIISRPNAGYGPRLLPRTILLLTPPERDPSQLIADSLTRCQTSAQTIGADHVREQTLAFGQKYRSWSEGSDTRKRK